MGLSRSTTALIVVLTLTSVFTVVVAAFYYYARWLQHREIDAKNALRSSFDSRYGAPTISGPTMSSFVDQNIPTNSSLQGPRPMVGRNLSFFRKPVASAQTDLEKGLPKPADYETRSQRGYKGKEPQASGALKSPAPTVSSMRTHIVNLPAHASYNPKLASSQASTPALATPALAEPAPSHNPYNVSRYGGSTAPGRSGSASASGSGSTTQQSTAGPRPGSRLTKPGPSTEREVVRPKISVPMGFSGTGLSSPNSAASTILSPHSYNPTYSVVLPGGLSPPPPPPPPKSATRTSHSTRPSNAPIPRSSEDRGRPQLATAEIQSPVPVSQAPSQALDLVQQPTALQPTAPLFDILPPRPATASSLMQAVRAAGNNVNFNVDVNASARSSRRNASVGRESMRGRSGSIDHSSHPMPNALVSTHTGGSVGTFGGRSASGSRGPSGGYSQSNFSASTSTNVSLPSYSSAPASYQVSSYQSPTYQTSAPYQSSKPASASTSALVHHSSSKPSSGRGRQEMAQVAQRESHRQSNDNNYNRMSREEYVQRTLARWNEAQQQAQAARHAQPRGPSYLAPMSFL